MRNKDSPSGTAACPIDRREAAEARTPADYIFGGPTKHVVRARNAKRGQRLETQRKEQYNTHSSPTKTKKNGRGGTREYIFQPKWKVCVCHHFMEKYCPTGYQGPPPSLCASPHPNPCPKNVVKMQTRNGEGWYVSPHRQANTRTKFGLRRREG